MFRRFLVAIVAITLAFPLSAWALDDESTIPEDHQKVLNVVMENLGIANASPKTKKSVYESFSFALKDGWHLYWMGNGDLDASKFKNSKVRIVDLLITNKSRFNTITLTYFPEAKQVYIVQKEFVETSSSNALEQFEKAKGDTNNKVIKETNNFGVTKVNESAEFAIYHLSSPNASITYVTYGLIDVL